MTSITPEQATQYVRTMTLAWLKMDDALAATLYTDDYQYRFHPMKAPVEGIDGIRDYWVREGVLQRELDIYWKDPVVSGRTLSVEIWSTMKYVGPMSDFGLGADALDDEGQSTDVTVAWVYVADFASNGLCCEMREYYHVFEGIHPPPSDYVHRAGRTT